MEPKDFYVAGQFLPGSIGPKIEAVIEFMEDGGKHVIIADLEQAVSALRGETSIHIVVDNG